MKQLISALVALTLFISCTKTEETPEPIDYTAQNDKEITDYIAENNLTAEKTASGLYYVINEPGDGAQPTATSNITVSYKAYHTDGVLIEESPEKGVSFTLNRAIKGWIEGLPYFKEGDSGILLVPSHLAYGSNSYGPVPAGSVIIFEVKLISVNENTAKTNQSTKAFPIIK